MPGFSYRSVFSGVLSGRGGVRSVPLLPGGRLGGESDASALRMGTGRLLRRPGRSAATGRAGCSEEAGGFSNKNAIFLPTCLQVRKFCLPLHSQWKRNAFRFLWRRGASLVADQEIGPAVVEVANGFSRNGAIAQLVEQRTENPCVPGSIPGGTTFKKANYLIKG